MTKHHGVRWMTNQSSHQYYILRWLSRHGKKPSASDSSSATESSLHLHPSLSSVCPLFRSHQTRNSRAADRRLAQQTKLLKERNASLLKAVGSVRANPSSSTVYIPGTTGPGEEYVRRLLIIMINQLTTLTAIPCAQHI